MARVGFLRVRECLVDRRALTGAPREGGHGHGVGCDVGVVLQNHRIVSHRRLLRQLAKFFHGKPGLIQDRSMGAFRHVLARVDGYGQDFTRLIGVRHMQVGATLPKILSACSMKSADQLFCRTASVRYPFRSPGLHTFG